MAKNHPVPDPPEDRFGSGFYLNHSCKFVFQIREFENRSKFANFGQIRVFGQIREFGLKFANLDLQIRKFRYFMGIMSAMLKLIILNIFLCKYESKSRFILFTKQKYMPCSSNIRQIGNLDIVFIVFAQLETFPIKCQNSRI